MDAPIADEFEIKTCELCIIGAGVAGLNALYVASQYLSPDDKVILVDRKPSAGGMWTETYDYVRLHQPHRMFTAGDIAWQPKRAPGYLAAKDEVLDHLSHCIEQLRDKVTLEEIYGFKLVDHAEVSIGAGYEAQLRIVPENGPQKPIVIKAKKCIKAFGFRVPKNDPLVFSSDSVRSVSPDSSDLVSDEMRDSEAPVFIVGGGKTAMDTAHMLINRYPHKDIHLVIGDGTVFIDRDKIFPKGIGRWLRGTTSLEAFADIALRFDGENESEVFDYFRDNYCLYLDKNNSQYMFGILSPAENDTIANGISSLTRDYVSDIIDRAQQSMIIYKSGQEQLVPRRSWIVNCTGYIMTEPLPYEPYLSEYGTTVSIQPTSSIHFLTTFAAYFIVHLFYLGKLPELPLYEVDYQALIRKNKATMAFTAMSQMLYNVILIIDAVPSRVMMNCGLDFDRWFPLPRRILGIIRLNRNKRRYLRHLQKSLDKVQRRYDMHCGVLDQLNAVNRSATAE